MQNSGLRKSVYILLLLTSFACGNKFTTSEECVNTFISAARQHDMGKAWNTLSPDARAFYNDIGEKNRKSGKGILEHDILEVTKFKTSGNDFRVEAGDNNSVKIISSGIETVIETTNINGEYRIKDGISVRNIIKAISSESVKREYY
jgi:hypothetical protein